MIINEREVKIHSIVSKLNYPELAEDAREVLRTFVHIEKTSAPATDAGLRCVSCLTVPLKTKLMAW